MMQASLNSASYLPLLQTLAGGLLTFLGGLLGSFLIQRAQRKTETESLASALYGEISASLLVLERRRYIQILSEALPGIKARGKAGLSYFEISDGGSFSVYEKNADKIGLLPNPLPERIFLFYGMITGALNDLGSLSKLKSEVNNPSEVEQYFIDLINDLNKVVESGTDIQAQIRSKFKRIAT